MLRIAGKLAQGRKTKVTSVDKSNVLETSRLWREVTEELRPREFAGVTDEMAGGRRRPGRADAVS